MSARIKRPGHPALTEKCCECQPAPCDPCEPAPCDLFVHDDTHYGEQTYTAITGTADLAWDELPVGGYAFEMVVSPAPFTPTWSCTDFSGVVNYSDLRCGFIGQSVLTDTMFLHYGGFPYEGDFPAFNLVRYRKLAHPQPAR